MSLSTDVGTVDRTATVSLSQVSKTFGGTRVLKGVDLALRPGEIHGLLGQNGSGKSTLIKILAGFYATDEEGCVRAAGEVLPNPIDPKTMKRMGWAFVHQDLALLRTLTVVDNFQMLGLRSGEGSTINWSRERRWVNEQLTAFGVDVRASALVNDLSPTQRAMVAVVRAATMMRHGQRDRTGADGRAEPTELLILDEPTVYLPERELDKLFNLVRRVAAGGASVLFVSHRLPEVRELTEAVTVLRDGYVVASAPTSSMTDRELVTAIVGKDITGEVARSESAPDVGAPLLHVAGASGAQVVDTDLELRAGEILGLAGLAGSGFDELPYLLFGARRAQGGSYSIDGTSAKLSSLNPKRAIDLGLALIPGNRLSDGAVAELSMRANMTLTSLKRFTSFGSVQRSNERAAVRDLAERYDIRPRRVDQRFGEFSGGNQQKGLMAKWLELDPRILMVHEPVQGLDVEARAQVLEQLKDLAARGAAVVIASSDFRDIASICHRALIFRQGKPVATLTGEQLTEERMTEVSHHNAHDREDAL